MEKKIIEFARQLYENLNNHQNDTVMAMWHDNGTLHINNELKDKSFITSLPPFIGFDLDTTKIISLTSILAEHPQNNKCCFIMVLFLLSMEPHKRFFLYLNY